MHSFGRDLYKVVRVKARYLVVKRVQGMPICFAQGIANSETVCAIFTEPKPNDWEAQSKLFATGAMSNRLCVRDLFAENKYRGQCGQTIDSAVSAGSL